MEHHGENPRQNVIAIIPARYASVRLPGKLLLEIAGKPLILHTLEQAEKARNVNLAIVATDDERIFNAVSENGKEVVMTRADHKSGSDRVAEVAEGLPSKSIIVNVQGDEPLISPLTIEKAVDALLKDPAADISTTCERIEKAEDVLSPDVVKVVSDRRGNALYFSRSPIPFLRDEVRRHGSLAKALASNASLLKHFKKHTGLYVFRREFLLGFSRMEQTTLEKSEMLEQLRALENGANLKVVEVEASSIGVDTAEDFQRVKEIIENGVPARFAVEKL